MSALSDLFPDGPRAGDAGAAVLDDHHTAQRLRQIIGEPREAEVATRPLADRSELIDMVEAARRTAVPVAAGADAPGRASRRPRRRFDAVTLTAAAVAVVAVATATVVGGIQMASASPASSALESLEADEAVAQNAYQSLKIARDRLVSDLDAQTVDAAQLRAALVETATAPDPAGRADDAPLSVTDADALAAALAALDAYVSGLAAITVAELPAEYARGQIDEDSLVQVGGAIDGVQERLVALDEATAEARALRGQLDALRPAASRAVDAYAASFVTAADAAVGRYPDGEEALRTAVSDAAARVVSADLWSAEGRSALTAYRDAFVSLVADQLRFEIERENRENAQQSWPQQNGTQDPGQDGSTGQNPVDPADPVDPVDPPDPVDPETPPEDGGTP
ncbi:hypothetical protein [Microbacterium paraoxydans]|uniref:hypothetical protein n=1 Tax=Microbacterium paraoxydans TaxID=199592 RepID=UPI001CFB12DE|nr:hypothetical protein [Microbacterium paraoxydans]